jgi:hypothetical protein
MNGTRKDKIVHSDRGTIKFVPCISNKNIFWPSLLIPEILLNVRMNFHICQMHKKSELRMKKSPYITYFAASFDIRQKKGKEKTTCSLLNSEDPRPKNYCDKPIDSLGWKEIKHIRCLTSR